MNGQGMAIRVMSLEEHDDGSWRAGAGVSSSFNITNTHLLCKSLFYACYPASISVGWILIVHAIV